MCGYVLAKTSLTPRDSDSSLAFAPTLNSPGMRVESFMNTGGRTMKVEIDFPDDYQSMLQSEADSLGIPLNAYLFRLLDLNRVDGKPRNGEELVEYWSRHGLIGSRGEIFDAADHARRLRERASRRDA